MAYIQEPLASLALSDSPFNTQIPRSPTRQLIQTPEGNTIAIQNVSPNCSPCGKVVEKCGEPAPCKDDPCKNPCRRGVGFVGFLVIFALALVFWFFLFWFIKPELLQQSDNLGRPNGHPDAGKTLVTALIFALLSALVIIALRSCW